MALTAMRITLDPTGAIGIGLTDTGATIEKVPPGSPIRELSPHSSGSQAVLAWRAEN
jgi:hypothetical protein